MNVRMLENKLREQLEKDRRRPSRRRVSEDQEKYIVTPSGRSCGLALAISLQTGEDDEDIMNRVAP